MAPTEAFQSLASIGTPAPMSPLPGGLMPVSVIFDAHPADNKVEWKFNHEGDDLGRIVATLTPDGDAASTVTVDYVNGTAPDDKWRNAEARRLIKTGVYRLVVEAVDSKLDGRPFDVAIARDVTASTAMASAGSIINDASASMDAEIARREEGERQAKAQAAMNPYAASRPATDLSKFNEETL